jgi:succinoglycan biosynthesis transport protein ExoP
MYQNKLHLRDYLTVILRRRWIVTVFSAALIITVLIFSIRQKPVYESTTTILINRSSPNVLSIQQVAPMGSGDYYNARDYYETQYKLIKSNTVLKNVAAGLGFGEESPYSMERLDKLIEVRPIKNSQLVEISVEDPNPAIAADIANAVVDEYIKNNLERNIEATNYAGKWLSERIEEQRNKLRDSEIALQKYREKHDIRILPLMSSEGAIEEIKVEYARLQSVLSNYLQRYTEKHPKVIEIRAQIRSLQDKIQGLEDVDTSKITLEYSVLEREVQSNKRIYEVLLARLKEIDLSSTLNLNNVSVIDRAEVPEKPVRPNLGLNMIMAVIAGVFGGILLAFFVEYMDTTLKTPEDIVEILESRFLEAIPDIAGYDDSAKYRILDAEPNSPVSEAYRSLRTGIMNSISGKSFKTILVTSAEPEAGKTITVANLSVAFAQEGRKVLLIDCDLRKPQQHRIFNLNRLQGLSEYLAGGIETDRIIQNTGVKNLWIITSGKVPSNPGEIIGSERMDKLIALFRKKFDYIIMDSPPVSSVTDPMVLANKADALIFVIRSGKSRVSAVTRAKERLSMSKAGILGVVLNGLKVSHSNYYYYRYGRYYTDKHKVTKNID